MRLIEDRVLIFNNYSLSITDGGPSGFLAQNLLGHYSKYYDFYTTDFSGSRKNRLATKMSSLSGLSKITAKKSGLNSENSFLDWGLNAQRIFKYTKAKQYKFIYFHDVWQLKFCLPLLNYSQIVTLQCHCPELPSSETSSQSKFTQVDVDWCKQAEKDAFNRANILIFPNKYVVEIYDSLINPASKIYYLSSGCKSRSDLRKYPVNDGIKILYIGRRNKIKGFDIILEAFRRVYESRKDINLILVGNGEQIIEEGIFDIGFTSTSHQWIYNCDYVVNCNRQSYFDLSVLESLSLGTPIILSANYGHKQFLEDRSQGIINFGLPTVENLEKILLSSLLRRKNDNFEAVADNKKLYKDKYSDIIYREKLNEILIDIMNNS
jgi:glycosyltransferase involved in cell wall biosynthesis